MTETNTKEEVTPDDLMQDFRGRSLKSIILFTVVAHAILLGAATVPGLLKAAKGSDAAGASAEDRLEGAVRDATSSLREIAEKHGVSPEELSRQFAGTRPAAPKTVSTAPETGQVEPAPPVGEDPKSEVEKELDVRKEGPALPSVPDPEEDLFR